MKRISYIELPKESGRFLSQNLIANNEFHTPYQVRLYTQGEMFFEIKNLRKNEVIYKSGTYKHLTSMKRAAKSKVKSFGVIFDLEIRDIKKGE